MFIAVVDIIMNVLIMFYLGVELKLMVAWRLLIIDRKDRRWIETLELTYEIYYTK